MSSDPQPLILVVDDEPDILTLNRMVLEKAGYQPGSDVCIALDPAASEFYSGGVYDLAGEGVKKSSDEMIGFVVESCRSPVVLDEEQCVALGVRVDDPVVVDTERSRSGIECQFSG